MQTLAANMHEHVLQSLQAWVCETGSIPVRTHLGVCSIAAIMSGRPLLVQPFTSLCSMSAQSRCLEPAGLVLGHTHMAVQSIEAPNHVHHGKLSTARSMSAGTFGAVCSALPVCGSVVSPYRSATASAAELPENHAEQTSGHTKQSHLSARQHQVRRPAADTAVVGWRVRDMTSTDQDIGIVSEVWSATTCGSRDAGPMVYTSVLRSKSGNCAVHPCAGDPDR